MTENQKDQTVKNNQNGNQNNISQNNQKKDGNPSGKTVAKEDEKVKPMPAEEGKEQEAIKHPHEKSIPVASKNENKGSF